MPLRQRLTAAKQAFSSTEGFKNAILVKGSSGFAENGKFFSWLRLSSNEHLDPTPPEERTWRWWHYTTIWVAYGFSPGVWTIGSSMIAGGLTVGQAVACVFIAHLLGGIALSINSRFGSTYHIGYPVYQRASFGMVASYLPILIRSITGVIWVGNLIYQGGEFMAVALRCIFGHDFNNIKNTIPVAHVITTKNLIGVIVFWILSVPMCFIKIHNTRLLWVFKCFILPPCVIGLFIYTQCMTKSTGVHFKAVKGFHGAALSWQMLKYINSAMGKTSPSQVNAPDSARYASTRSAPIWSQLITIPLANTAVSCLGIFATSAVYAQWGTLYWNPWLLMGAILDHHWTGGVRFAMLLVSLAWCFSCAVSNIYANVVPFGADMSALLPRLMNINRGSFIVYCIGLAINPWYILATATSFVTFLSGYSIFMGPAVGISAVDYFYARRGNIDVRSLYTGNSSGVYWYNYGVSWRAQVAFWIGCLFTLPGFAGGFAGTHVPTAWIHLFYIGWIFSITVSAFIYAVLVTIWPTADMLEARAAPFESWADDQKELLDRSTRVIKSETGSGSDEYDEKTEHRRIPDPPPPRISATDVYAQTIEELKGLREDATKYNQRVSRLERLVSELLSTNGDITHDSPLATHPSQIIASQPSSSSPNYDFASTSTGVDSNVPSGSTLPRGKGTTLEADATFPLELMALGRQPGGSDTKNVISASRTGFELSSGLSSPILAYPSGASLAAAAPVRHQAEALLSYAVGSLGWLLCCLHAPSFMDEVSAFWQGGADSFESYPPDWIALYFAVLLTAVQLLREDQRVLLGISQEQSAALTKQWFTASVACLYRADFLQHHTIVSLQTIAILSHCGKDDWSANYLGTLNNTALSIAVEMNLHRMSSNEEWEREMVGQPYEVRVKTLILRETCKRVFWSLNREEWFGVNWRRRNPSALRPALLSTSLITTPLMLNAHDRDLLRGDAIDRPASEYTVVSFALVKANLARHLQQASEYLDSTSAPSFDMLQKLHYNMKAYLSTLPAWWRDGPPVDNMTSSFDWLRYAFTVTTNHKILTLHRLFWTTEGDDPRYAESKRQAMEAVEAMLRVAPLAGECRAFIVIYQISVSAFFSLRNLFAANQPIEVVQAQRTALHEVLVFLSRAKRSNGIARNAFDLISKLLEEEAKFYETKEAAGVTASSQSASLKGTNSEWGPTLEIPGSVPLETHSSGLSTPDESAGLLSSLFRPFDGDDQWLFDASLLGDHGEEEWAGTYQAEIE